MEQQKRPVKFDDVVMFIDREARIATNPVFGKILQTSVPKPGGFSFVVHVEGDPTLTAGSDGNVTVSSPKETSSVAPISGTCVPASVTLDTHSRIANR